MAKKLRTGVSATGKHWSSDPRADAAKQAAELLARRPTVQLPPSAELPPAGAKTRHGEQVRPDGWAGSRSGYVKLPRTLEELHQPAAESWRPSDRQAAAAVRHRVIRRREDADEAELVLVAELRANGFSWERIAAVFGRTRQAHRKSLERLSAERGMTVADLG